MKSHVIKRHKENRAGWLIGKNFYFYLGERGIISNLGWNSGYPD
jgi:hypothetical protein